MLLELPIVTVIAVAVMTALLVVLVVDVAFSGVGMVVDVITLVVVLVVELLVIFGVPTVVFALLDIAALGVMVDTAFNGLLVDVVLKEQGTITGTFCSLIGGQVGQALITGQALTIGQGLITGQVGGGFVVSTRVPNSFRAEI